MIHARVTIVFQPAGGTSADAIPAANQQVFIDLTAGAMSTARTNASGLLISGVGAGTPVPLDDARTYSVVVLPTAPSTPPSASSGATLRVSSGRLTVTPHISIRVAGSGGAAAASLACTLTVGTSQSNVTTSRTGWIISNDRSSGVVTLTSATRLLLASGAAVPAVTLTAPSGSITRGATARFSVNLPAGIFAFHVTQWSYILAHTNPNGTAQSATIARPSPEAAATFDQFWEGEMCAGGNLSIHFVAGATLRSTGGASVSVTLTAMEPQTTTLDVTVISRGWTTPLTQDPESTFTRAIGSFHDTGHHNWTSTAIPTPTVTTVSSGPNRGCRFVASASGLAFTSNPQINADIVNTASAFQSAQGSARVLSPPALRGRIIPTRFYSTTAAGVITITDVPGLLSHFSLTSSTGFSFLNTECIAASDLLVGTRNHEHVHPTGRSHKENCLKALRALEPLTFLEGFIDAPGGAAVNFSSTLTARVTKVINAAATHNIIDEAATQLAGDLRFVSGQQIPDVNLDSAGNTRPVWNPATNSQLTN